ncbi:MAG: DNA polymerase I [Actinobacteria bacterium]|nr:DNA polymerase I [Actinomycetota bacterium]
MSLAFRAFYALSTEIATSEGIVTNALHGFASMLNTLIKTQSPRALVVAFDLPGGTFRDEMAIDYKGGRAETPIELDHQFDLIRNFCEVLAIPVIGVPGYEADDVLATLATWGRDNGIPTIVVTGDRDSFQLVEDPYIRVLYNKRGVSDYDLYDEAGIFARCGVEPARYPMLAALRGDPSDNLPGVPGVGEKTAARLLSEYADFDEIFAATASMTPKLRENMESNESLARSNLEVMRLVRTVPIAVQPDHFHLGDWDRASINAFFERFEMSAMKVRYDRIINEGLLGLPAGFTEPSVTSATVDIQTLVAAPNLDELEIGSGALVAWSGSRIAVTDLKALSVYVGEVSEVGASLAGLRLGGHDLKGLYRTLGDLGVVLGPPLWDTAIAGYLIDSASGAYSLESLVAQYLGAVVSTAPVSLFDADSSDELLIARLSYSIQLHNVLERAIEQSQLGRVYFDIELPLVAVLARMEVLGIRVDRALLVSIADSFGEEVARLDAKIQKIAGHDFKVNSPAQLQTVLFNELGLTPTKKIKSGFSTDATSLEAIIEEHEIIPEILRFRELDKLRGTYGAPLIATVAIDERIHATFHQTVARTGRLSSESPNLHNIPVRSEEGRRLRTAFIPRENWKFLVADYNQIELRILAHLSQDPGLLEAFESAQDVHTAIASVVFDTDLGSVSKDQREQAKAVSYGLAYGMEAFGLSQRLGISVGEAKAIMNQYFEGFPSLKAYTERAVQEVRVQGFSRTEFGRIRPFPDLATASGPQKAAAERQAMNAGIQGLAADIFKYALVRLDQGLSSAGLDSRLVLQVHDEVVVESPDSEHLEVAEIVKTALTGAASLSVPLEISLNWGTNWSSAK